MSITISYGIDITGYDDEDTPSDLGYMVAGAQLLRLASTLTGDYSNLITLASNSLTVQPYGEFPRSFQDAYRATYGDAIVDPLDGVTLTYQLNNGSLGFRGNGTIRDIGGDVGWLTFAASATERIETQIFQPFGIGGLIDRTATAPLTSYGDAYTDYIDYFTPSPSINYSYTGTSGRDAAETGTGQSIVTTGGGKDVVRPNPGGYGTLDGGRGIDMLSLDNWSIGARVDYRSGIVIPRAPIPGNDGYDVTGFEGAMGGSARDLMIGNGRANTFWGGNGNDLLKGFGGRDVLYGGGSRDTMVGGNGADALFGGRGNDRIEGGKGNDRIDSGPGADRIEFRLGVEQGRDVIDGFSLRLDTIGMRGAVSEDDFNFRYLPNAGDTRVTYDDGDGGLNRATFLDVRLTIDNFEF